MRCYCALVLLSFGACGRPLDVPEHAVSATQHALCAAQTSMASCTAQVGCTGTQCLACTGAIDFASCTAEGESPSVCPHLDCGGGGCSAITDNARCDTQLGCHSMLSGDLPCDSNDCTDHFIRCLDGTAVCSKPSGGDCGDPPPTCRTGDTLDYSSGACPDGCVARSSCAEAT